MVQYNMQRIFVGISSPWFFVIFKRLKWLLELFGDIRRLS